jgi:predicted HNH restriction endonuclease
MSERPLIQWIITAFHNLGGRAHLRKVYKEVRHLGYDRGGQDLDKIIRSEIQKHSADSRRFSRNPEHNLFRHIGEERSGVWELREDGAKLETMTLLRLPEEVPGGSDYSEGSVQRILVNRYERDPRARAKCIRHYGTRCFLCGFDFVAVYGTVMEGFTHVHHLKSLASVGAGYKVDPVRDLRPVCPNCHAVLHRREPPYSLDEVRLFLQANRQ